VSLSCTVSEIQRDIGKKIADVNLPHLYLAPRCGDVVGISPRFWDRKTRVPGLSYGVDSVILGLATFVQLRLVTDRQTDKQTHDDS